MQAYISGHVRHLTFIHKPHIELSNPVRLSQIKLPSVKIEVNVGVS